jgi:hypothetical protein
MIGIVVRRLRTHIQLVVERILVLKLVFLQVDEQIRRAVA